MSTKTEASIDELHGISTKAELANGEVVLISPSGGLPGIAGLEIAASLRAYAKRTGNGRAIPDNVGFVVDLPHRKSFSPDVAFHVGPVSMKFINGAPVFAVEVRSECDYGPVAELEMATKRADYFAAGTLVVWDVDLQGIDTIRSYRASEPNNPLVFRRGDSAHAEPAVPEWTMPVDDLWP